LKNALGGYIYHRKPRISNVPSKIARKQFSKYIVFVSHVPIVVNFRTIYFDVFLEISRFCFSCRVKTAAHQQQMNRETLIKRENIQPFCWWEVLSSAFWWNIFGHNSILTASIFSVFFIFQGDCTFIFPPSRFFWLIILYTLQSYIDWLSPFWDTYYLLRNRSDGYIIYTYLFSYWPDALFLKGIVLGCGYFISSRAAFQLQLRLFEYPFTSNKSWKMALIVCKLLTSWIY